MGSMAVRYSFPLALFFLLLSVVFIALDTPIFSPATSLRETLPWIWSYMSARADGGANPISDDNGANPVSKGGSYSCSKDSPCSNGACCGKDGWCGFGPTYCDKGCQSNCDAHAECGQYAKKAGQTCPLNVCCSEFGFCGTTSDFCGHNCQSNCGSPNRPKGAGGDVRNNIIGYYESWKSSTGGCGHMTPSQIPVESLNAVNLAFTYITPDDYDIVPMEEQTESIFQQVADVKKRSPKTEVWLSVGGWTFNDNKTLTQPIFGELAADSSKAKVFANKLVKMMNHYGFDGVDIDWEYPGATDRGGKEEIDIKNFPTMLKNIREVFKGQLQGFKLSITVPTSYWYLRWFDLPELAKHLDFFNVMSYDLHGTWDSSNPIGPHVYAHTNLTEIEVALDLFWREDISPDIINLGLAFYGRSFKLKDPSCSDPGCIFKGPGSKGRCTDTAGILSYREIGEHRKMSEINKGSYTIHDKEAAINYMVYGDKKDDWISFDTKETFEQKIEFANNLGLRGLLIWAIDQDDDRYTALKAVTGKDINPRVDESESFGHWDVNKCYVTGCKQDCADGFTKMTNLNDDAKTGKGCGGNHKRRKLCCPSWGAPDPSTCYWRGRSPICSETCDPGDILFATDHYGNGGHWCYSGSTKKYCCPANNGNRAVAACRWVSTKTCPKERPQKMYTYTESSQVDSETVFGTRTYCCPKEPDFQNCTWHGDVGSCNNNFCPKGKIELLTSTVRPEGKCIYGRKAVLCCDPPKGDAILPVVLEDLFPYDIPEDDTPAYAESIDNFSESIPNYDGLDDPNEQPFAWIVMVGDKEDVQSLRKRDGSHLELFDCPDPTKDDLSTQRLKAICMSNEEVNNCEHLNIGGAHGTIARLPEHCGPDEWVRVTSFKIADNQSVPSHLEKRAPQDPKVYHLEYDYKFHELRADGNEVYVRVDSSSHPGCWDSIVASKTGKGVSRRNPENWREDEMTWFQERGFIQNDIANRGESSSAGWWVGKFSKLISDHDEYGIHKRFDYNQVLYSASKSCPGLAEASFQARLEGHLETTFDFGISLIGTLKKFNFDQSYAYFHLNDFNMSATSVLDAYAKIQLQSKKSPILNWLDIFGGNFNVKGLLEVGPFFDIQAQLRAAVTLSGEARAGLTFGSSGLTWMYPQSMQTWPGRNDITTYDPNVQLRPKTEVSIRAKGDITVAINPALGFQVKLTWNGQQLANNDVRLNFQCDYTFAVTAEKTTKSTCDGLLMGVDLKYGLAIDMSKPLPGWKNTDSHHEIIKPRSVTLAEAQCKKWAEGDTGPNVDSGKRGLAFNGTNLILARADEGDDALFPDVSGLALRCPTNFKTPTGDCSYKSDDEDDATLETRALFKRAGTKPMVDFCQKVKKMTLSGFGYPDSSDMLQRRNHFKEIKSFLSWGPEDPDECDDYNFIKYDKEPSADKSGEFEAEHVLEYQTLTSFLQYVGNLLDAHPKLPKSPYVGQEWDNPLTPELKKKRLYPDQDKLNLCQYMFVWWHENKFEFKGTKDNALNHLRLAIPNNNFYADELQLLWEGANNNKQALWNPKPDQDVRNDKKMQQYIKGYTEKGKVRDINDAINALKSVIFAVQYMEKPEVKRVMFAQADRINKRLEDFEDRFVQQGTNKDFNIKSYQKLDLAAHWRKWCTSSYELANIKQKRFLEKWIPRLKEDYLGTDDDASSNDSSGDGNGEDEESGNDSGGSETNPDIRKRVKALVGAYDSFKASTTWTDPFNWDGNPGITS